jgi:hypothetical protein
MAADALQNEVQKLVVAGKQMVRNSQLGFEHFEFGFEHFHLFSVRF